MGRAGLVKIVAEESVSAGTRRITALTGKAALDYVKQEEAALAEVASALRVPPGQAAARVLALLDEVKALKKQSTLRKADSAPRLSPDDLLASAISVGDARVIAQAIENTSPDDLRQLIDVLRRKAGTNLAVLLASSIDGKVALAAGVTPDLVALGLHAGNWLKEVAPAVGGGGGGRPDMAQAGGKDPSKIPEALARAIEAARAKLGG